MTESKRDFDAKAATWDDDPKKTERAVAVAQGIRANAPLSPTMTGFEYGCGTGLLSIALQPYLKHITLADSSSGMLAVLREKIAVAGIANLSPVLLDLVTDPLPAERYKLIYTLMTFHHIEDIDKMLGACYALLDPPGYLCVADLDSEDGTFHGPEFTGHKGFDRADLGRRAARAGFGKVAFTSVFQMKKGKGPGQTEFPIFLMVAEKSGPT